MPDRSLAERSESASVTSAAETVRAKRGAEHVEAREHEQSSSVKQARLDSCAYHTGAGGEESADFTLENKNQLISKEVLAQLWKSKVRKVVTTQIDVARKRWEYGATD